MDVRLPSGEIIKDVPEGTTKAQLAVKLHSNGYQVPQEWLGAEVPKKEEGFWPNIFDKIKGAAEAGAALVTGATTGVAARVPATLAGIAGSVRQGEYGTMKGAEMAHESAEDASRRFTYEPKSEAGKEMLSAIGRLFDESKLAGLGPSEAVMAGNVANAARPAARQAVGHAARVLDKTGELAKKVLPKEVPDEPVMAGVGAATTNEEAVRRARAANLPVPIELTKGQATRDFAQQQFERETAKSPKVGDPLRQRFAEQNEKILQNFDAWIDQTGAEGGSLRATGQSVTQAIVDKANKAKTQIRAAYKDAQKSGDMQERVDTSALKTYLQDNEAAAANAGVLTTAEKQLSKIVDKEGKASINDLEEMRKLIGKVSGKDATNADYGRTLKGVIDGMMEGKGGDLYKKARALRFRYAQEFEDHAVVDKLLSFKPGTKDRAVAFEDVFDHSVMKGSLDDVRTLRKTLQTSGEQGQQAWKELQGATLQHIKDEITKNVQIDQAGNRVISPARLDRIVTELDKDGKLDFIFGKAGAQQIRDVNGIAQDVFTSPPGAVNHSNTAGILLQTLDKVASKVTGVPFVGSAARYAVGEVKAAKDRKRVQETLQ